MPTADIDGPQTKIVTTNVRPARAGHGSDGIPIRAGRTLPFVVERGWNAPLGYYTEAWFLIDPSTREVLFEGPAGVRLIRGLPTITDVADEVRSSFPLQPGTYAIVFVLNGTIAAEVEVRALEVPSEEAA